MSSPPRRSLQTRGRNRPARNALHPPRGARSAVACRALSGAPAPARARQPGLPRGPRAGRGGLGALPQVARAGQQGRPLAPPSRVANPSATTAAGVATTRRGPTSPAVAVVPAVAPWRIGGPRSTTGFTHGTEPFGESLARSLLGTARCWRLLCFSRTLDLEHTLQHHEPPSEPMKERILQRMLMHQGPEFLISTINQGWHQ